MKYSVEKGVQMIIALLKEHGIRKVIASPGSTNVCLVASLQSDDFFEIYSSVDERSAAYLACGLACESNEAVVLTCTEATASRNYISGLTEAYYRKLPILVITATNDRTKIGQNHPQMIDRSQIANDIVKKSLYLPFITREKEIIGWSNLLNGAILELFRHGSGPVHIEYETEYSCDYTVKELLHVRASKRYTIEDKLPDLPNGKIAIVSGAHKKWSEELVQAVERFCEHNNAVILADHISNYKGKYRVNPTIVTSQAMMQPLCCEIDTLIYIGDISSSYKKNYKVKNSWRVNPDGEIRNVFGNLSMVFEMSELAFFSHYAENGKVQMNIQYFEEWKAQAENLYNKVPELPFSNLWIAQQLGKKLPEGSALFLGIENSLRCWNFWDIPKNVYAYCNTGGFGIDGGVSSLVGASFFNPNKLYYGVTGDLAFFYDMNVLGNRHIGKNVRLLVINNAIGQQFKNPGHPAAISLGEMVDEYVAAAGHFGNKSVVLLKHYAEDLGFEYISASSKSEFMGGIDRFVSPQIGNKSIVFEVFTNSEEEAEALERMNSLDVDTSFAAKDAIKKIIGNKGINIARNILRR